MNKHLTMTAIAVLLISGSALAEPQNCNANPNQPFCQPGPVGPAGPQGPQGIPGLNGTNGTNGTNGLDGKDGKDGLSIIGQQGPRNDAGIAIGAALAGHNWLGDKENYAVSGHWGTFAVLWRKRHKPTGVGVIT